MKFIPLCGSVITDEGPVVVNGFAFQIPGFEYLHTWVTPFFGWKILNSKVSGSDMGFVVSHWESGRSVFRDQTRVATKEKAAERAAQILSELGHEKVRAVIGEWLVEALR